MIKKISTSDLVVISSWLY